MACATTASNTALTFREAGRAISRPSHGLRRGDIDTVGGVDPRNALISRIYLHFTIPLAGKNQVAGETKIDTVISCM